MQLYVTLSYRVQSSKCEWAVKAMLYFTSKYLVTAVLLEKISVVILPHKLQKLKRFFFSTSGFKLTVISLDIHSGTIFCTFLDPV